MAPEKAGVKLVAEDAAKFQQDITKATQAIRNFGTSTAEVQARLARGDATFAAITNRTADLRTGILRTKIALNEFGSTIDAELAEADAEFEKAFNVARLTEFAAELSRVGTIMIATGAAAGGLIVATGLQASRIEELGILLEVTRKNAIYMAEAEGNLATAATFTIEAVQEQVQGIRDLHLSGEVANKTVAELIRYNLDWTRATELARLAQDAATFAMQDSSEAVSGLVHGIATLQPRVLRTYGLMINLNEAYRRYAEANNFAAKDLTTAQRQQAAFNEVLRLAPSIAGAYEAAMSTASKQVRSFRTDLVNLAEEFGEEYTPALAAAVGGIRDFIHWLTALDDPFQAFITYSTAAGSGLLILGGAVAKLGGAIVPVIADLYTLAGAATAAELAVGGLTAAALLGIPAIIGLGAALYRAEEGRREEASSIILSSDNYETYISALRRAELSSYALTESLYDLVKGHEEAGDAALAHATAEELVANVQSAKLLFSIYGVIGGLDAMTEGVRQNIHIMDESQLLLYANKDAMLQMALAAGYSTKEALAFAKAVSELARQEQFTREITNAFTKEAEDWDYNARKQEETTIALTEGFHRLDVSLAAVNWSKSRREIAETTEATKELTDALEEQNEAYAKFDRQAAEATLDAHEKAAEARIEAEERKNEAIEDLNKDHANKMEDIYEDLAQVEIDLQKEIAEAEKETAQARLELQQELARDLEDLARELARDLEDLERDRKEKLKDLDRDYAQDREDALRDLNRDLADLERDLAKDLEGIRRDHLEDMLDLEKEYANKRQDILDDYAQQAQDIEEKYSTEPPAPTFDELRKALLDQLEELRRLQEENPYYDYTSQIDEVLAQLDELKQAELDALEKAKQEELALLEEQLAEEQAARDEAYQRELEEAQAAYEEKRTERLRQYTETLEDLKRELERQRAEINLDAARRKADLERKHAEERAEIQRRHAEALADLDTQLAEEKARLDAAAEEDRQRLADRLQDERDNYADRRQELEDDYSKRLAIIGRDEQKEVDEIAAKNAIKKQDWIDTYDAIYQSTVDGLQRVLDNAVIPGLQAIVNAHKAKIQEILDAWNNSGLPGQSPSPFFKDMAKSWGEGLKAGLSDSAFKANVNAVIGDLQTQMQTVLPAQQVSMPMGMGRGNATTTNTTNLNINPTYQQAQSPSSIAQDLGLWVGTMRAWNR